MEYQKPKSAHKVVIPNGPKLTAAILDTMKTISSIVGSTLGPGGKPVLIERFEHGMPPTVTKDGVTVFKSLGFLDPVAHAICETGRDAAIRTVAEAGDGTTTATVLAEAIVRLSQEYCAKNPRVRPQVVARRLEALFRDVIEPTLRKEAIRADLSKPAGRKNLRAVAKVSANGDEELADAVLQCFDIVGDAGNVTITEQNGPSRYEVEKIEGFPVETGYDDSAGIFGPKFVNDAGRQLCVMNNPLFILYNGEINNSMECLVALTRIGERFEAALHGGGGDGIVHNCVVVVAAKFSEQVRATFAASWGMAEAIKVFPLVVPHSIVENYQTQFLDDLAAVTGATVFEPINKPLDTAVFEDFGPGLTAFEAGRVRSTIIGSAAEKGDPYESILLDRVAAVETQIEAALSLVDKLILQKRMACLTGGIARLRIVGSSNGELKEKAARADDAVCAVRGAIKHGCLPGGGWGLLRAIWELDQKVSDHDDVVHEILVPALKEPVKLMLQNCGFTDDTIDHIVKPIWENLARGSKKALVYDAMANRHGDARKLGILDSAPAVIEAIRNSMSMAGTLGTMGGIVVFARDEAIDRKEAHDVQEWLRNAGVNEADERA